MRIKLEKHKLELAKEHYSFTLIRKYGIEPLKRIVEIAQLNFHVSEKHRNSNLLRCVLLEWNDFTKAVIIEKNKKADNFFMYILLQRSFRSWQKVGHYDSIILLLIDFLIACFIKLYILNE